MLQPDSQYIFERLDAYRVAREALELVLGQRERLKGIPGEVASQLERAAVSTVANIAEATGQSGIADRRRVYALARGEANEAGAMIEIAALYGRIDAATHRALRDRYLRVARMLTALLRA